MVKKPVPVKEIPKTKEQIFQVCSDYGMSEKIFLEEIKKNGCGGAFKPVNWRKYIQVIEKWRMLNPKPAPEQRCAICGEIMGVDPDLLGLFRLSPMTGMRCKDRHHFFMLLEANRISQENKCTFEQAVQVVCFIESKRTVAYEDRPFNLYEDEYEKSN